MLHIMFRASAIFLLWFVCGCSCQGPPPTPCPDVFSYQRDPSGRWYGLVTILSPATFSEARLILKMTVDNYRLDKGYGSIAVLGGESEIQEISKSAYNGVRRKIQFLITFPPINTIPRVTEVRINDVMFCADIRSYENVAKIELNYVLKTGVDAGQTDGNAFSTVPARLHGNGNNAGSSAWAQPTRPTYGLNPPQASHTGQGPGQSVHNVHTTTPDRRPVTHTPPPDKHNIQVTFISNGGGNENSEGAPGVKQPSSKPDQDPPREGTSETDDSKKHVVVRVETEDHDRITVQIVKNKNKGHVNTNH